MNGTASNITTTPNTGVVSSAKESAELARIKEVILNAASHELRTPLTNMKAYSQYAMKSIPKEDKINTLWYIQSIKMHFALKVTFKI